MQKDLPIQEYRRPRRSVDRKLFTLAQASTMKPKVKKKRGHRGGQWFTTQKPDSTGLHGVGAHDIGGFFLIILFLVAYAFIVRVYRFVLQLKSSLGKWKDYQGLGEHREFKWQPDALARSGGGPLCCWLAISGCRMI